VGRNGLFDGQRRGRLSSRSASACFHV
jgi:hypothetical protein